MWNKDQKPIEVAEGANSNRGSRVRKEYNIHDGTTIIRPLTRSNQRRPVSRQVNPSAGPSDAIGGISVSKILV